MNKVPLQFSHANGFPATTYRQLFLGLEQQFGINYVDVMGKTSNYPITNNWPLLVDELINNIEQHNSDKVIGLGHSLGGVITFLAACKRPDLFRAVLMLDAPLLAKWKLPLVRFLKKINQLDRVSPGGRYALTRRNSWTNKKEVISHLSDKKTFSKFTRECLNDFASYGTIEDSKLGRELKIPPKLEHDIYMTFPDNISLDKFKLEVPCWAVLGVDSKMITRTDRLTMQNDFKISFVKTRGGHLFPFEDPDGAAEVIMQILEKVI